MQPGCKPYGLALGNGRNRTAQELRKILPDFLKGCAFDSCPYTVRMKSIGRPDTYVVKISFSGPCEAAQQQAYVNPIVFAFGNSAWRLPTGTLPLQDVTGGTWWKVVKLPPPPCLRIWAPKFASNKIRRAGEEHPVNVDLDATRSNLPGSERYKMMKIAWVMDPSHSAPYLYVSATGLLRTGFSDDASEVSQMPLRSQGIWRGPPSILHIGMSDTNLWRFIGECQAGCCHSSRSC